MVPAPAAGPDLGVHPLDPPLDLEQQVRAVKHPLPCRMMCKHYLHKSTKLPVMTAKHNHSCRLVQKSSHMRGHATRGGPPNLQHGIVHSVCLNEQQA